MPQKAIGAAAEEELLGPIQLRAKLMTSRNCTLPHMRRSAAGDPDLAKNQILRFYRDAHDNYCNQMLRRHGITQTLEEFCSDAVIRDEEWQPAPGTD